MVGKCYLRVWNLAIQLIGRDVLKLNREEKKKLVLSNYRCLNKYFLRQMPIFGLIVAN